MSSKRCLGKRSFADRCRSVKSNAPAHEVSGLIGLTGKYQGMVVVRIDRKQR